MKIALRGEGPTDMGSMDGMVFKKGPMVILIEKMECFLTMKEECCGGVDECIEWVYITKEEIKESKGRRKKVVLRAKKDREESERVAMEMKRFVRDAEAFATLSGEREADLMIFFVDGDKGNKKEYGLRYASVKNGFRLAGKMDSGVPMVPNKISEAWLLCCLEDYRSCERFETLPTGDESNARHPKRIIRDRGMTVYEIADKCDPNRIDMPSFNRFREDFSATVNQVCGYGIC